MLTPTMRTPGAADLMAQAMPAMSPPPESGTISVSERYVAAVLKVCELPADWAGSKRTRRAKGKQG